MSCVNTRLGQTGVVFLSAAALWQTGCFDPGLLSNAAGVPVTSMVDEPPVLEPIRSVSGNGTTPSKTGDLNNDNTVDVFDLGRFDYEMDRFENGFAFNLAADLDGDDTLSARDREMLVDLIGGDISSDVPVEYR